MQKTTGNFERVLANFALLMMPATVVGKALITQPAHNCCRMFTGTSFSGDFRDICYDVNQYGEYGQKSEWYGYAGSYWCGQSVSYSFCTDDTSDCSGQKGVSGAGNIKNINMDIRWGEDHHQLERIYLRHYDAS